MSTRSKDGIRKTCICCNKYELKAINCVVQRKSILDPVNSEAPIKRDLENPDDLMVHLKPGEGQRPIFDREDIRVNEERQIILTDLEQSCLKENGTQLCSEKSEVGNRLKNRSHSRERRSVSTENGETPFERNGSPNWRNVRSSENVKRRHRRSRSASRTRSFRSRSPYTSDRRRPSKRKSSCCESNREYERPTKTYKRCSRSSSPCCGEENLREGSISSNRSGNRRSHSREHRTPENSFRSSCKFPYKSENLDKPLKRKLLCRESSEEYERYAKRPRRYSRSLSPYYNDRPGSHSSPTYKVDRNKRSFRRRSPYSNKDERDGKSHRRCSPPRHRNDGYRTHSPSPKRKQYHPVLPPYLGAFNYGPQWHSWPQPIEPRFISPPGQIRMQQQPVVSMPPFAMRQTLHPPIIYNSNRSVNTSESMMVSTRNSTFARENNNNSNNANVNNENSVSSVQSVCESTTNF